MQDKILIIGSGGQIGVELFSALQNAYSNEQVIASDLKEHHPVLESMGRYLSLDAIDMKSLAEIIDQEKISQIYLLAAVLSATGEKNPSLAWNVNMNSLMGLLNLAVEKKLHKIYWPSSIAVFGSTTPKINTEQRTIIEPETMYGITKYAGENLCAYYRKKFNLDVRGLRYPGLISYKNPPGGGTTDYAIDIFHQAIEQKKYNCFLAEDTYLPMMYMDDAIRATMEIMHCAQENIKEHGSYNISAMSFSPKEIADKIKKHIPEFSINYVPDYRQDIAAGWPKSIDDSAAQNDWQWKAQFDLEQTVITMLKGIRNQHGA